jgi:hypothetical protein
VVERPKGVPHLTAACCRRQALLRLRGSDKCNSCYYESSRFSPEEVARMPAEPMPNPAFSDQRFYSARFPELPGRAIAKYQDECILTVRREWNRYEDQDLKYEGQERSKQLVVIIEISGLTRDYPNRDPDNHVRQIMIEEAVWDSHRNSVKIGSPYIEVKDDILRQRGIGKLMLNTLIEWAKFYHNDATVEPMKVTDHNAEHSPVHLYRQHGYVWGKESESRVMPMSQLTTSPLKDYFKPEASDYLRHVYR